MERVETVLNVQDLVQQCILSLIRVKQWRGIADSRPFIAKAIKSQLDFNAYLVSIYFADYSEICTSLRV